MPGTVDNKLIYHLGVFIPFWVLELLAEILVIIAGALGLTVLISVANDNYCVTDQFGDQECATVDQSALSVGYAATGVELGLGLVFLISHIVQIALFGRRKLTPAANFGIELSRFIVWLIVLILAIVSFSNGGSTGLGLIIVIIIWALYLGSTIYSIVIFHRARRGLYNGSSTAYGMPPVESAQTTYPPHQPQAQEMNMAQQQHYGPGPYQHPGDVQQNPYQQRQTYQSSHAPTSPITSAHSSQLGSAYAPTHRPTGFPGKEVVNNGH